MKCKQIQIHSEFELSIDFDRHLFLMQDLFSNLCICYEGSDIDCNVTGTQLAF